MIRSKADFLSYVKEDQTALGFQRSSFRGIIKKILAPDPIRKFQFLMRRCEYYTNVKKGPLNKIFLEVLKFRYRRLSLRLGFSIPINVFGPGLAIVHYGTIVVSKDARVGANCRIHPSTCIGASGGGSEAPQIGDNVYIAPGAKIYGGIRIPNNVAIAANASVCDSFLEENIIIGGVPAKKIGKIDISTIIKHLGKEK